jgi:hypothetical protein
MKSFDMEYDFYKFLVSLTLPSLLILLVIRIETGRDVYALPLIIIGFLFVYATIVLALVLNAKHKQEQELKSKHHAPLAKSTSSSKKR